MEKISEEELSKIENKLKQVSEFKPHVVLMFGTMMHMIDKNQMLDNIYNLLANGGFAIVNHHKDDGISDCKSSASYLSEKNIPLILETNILIFTKRNEILNIDCEELKSKYKKNFDFKFKTLKKETNLRIEEIIDVGNYGKIIDRVSKILYKHYWKKFISNQEIYDEEDEFNSLLEEIEEKVGSVEQIMEKILKKQN